MNRTNVAVTLGVVAVLALVGGGIYLMLNQSPNNQTKAASDDKAAAEAKKLADDTARKTTKENWATDARFATVSPDGSTVVYLTKRTIVTVKNGVELRRDDKVNHLHPRIRLNADGSQMALSNMWREKVVLIDTATAKELGTADVGGYLHDFDFTKDGSAVEGKKGPDLPIRIDTGKRVIVNTHASVSDDGKTVLVQEKGKKARVIRQGEELFTLDAGLDGLVINRDGSRLLARDDARGKLVLLDTGDKGRVVREYASSAKMVYHFSPGGWNFGTLEPGAEGVLLYHASRGTPHEMGGWGEQKNLLTAKYQFRIDRETLTIRYKVKSFHWYNVEPVDSPLTVNFVTQSELQPSEKEWTDRESSVQLTTHERYWTNRKVVYGCLDQRFDFEADGSLTRYASK